ncbi:MAG: dicarboxylate transporter/tellurite-resistance protein TehA [Betaproteobacteria bacterium]
MTTSRPAVPASIFGMVLGLVGLGDCWRVAAMAWGYSHAIDEIVMGVAFLVWLLVLILYIGKWFWARDEAIAELNHPVQSCFIGLSGVATMLAAVSVAPPHSTGLPLALAVVGAVLTQAYGVYFTARHWRGGRELETASPALYLPTVAGNFVSAFVAGYFGYETLGQLFLGAGMFSWLALESLITHRLSFVKAMAPPLRPAMGIMLAPPVVGCLAYLFVTGGMSGGKPDLFAQALLGYGLLQLALLLCLLPWIAKQPFAASYWAFSFGVTALAFDAIVFMLRGQTGYIEWLAPVLFVLANVTMVILILGTLWRLAQGKLLAPRITAQPV